MRARIVATVSVLAIMNTPSASAVGHPPEGIRPSHVHTYEWNP